MTDKTLFLGLELTYSHLVILLIDQEGEVLQQLQRSHSSQGSEQAPQDWWRAVRTGIKECLRRAKISNKDIRAVGITAHSDAPVLLDVNGVVLCKTHVGPHDIDEDLHSLLVKTVGARNLQNITNQPARANGLAAKLLYMKENNKRAWHDTAHILMPSSYLRNRLTGKFSTDAGSAGETQLFNTKQRAWSKVLLQRMGIPPAWMPTIGPGTQICGRVIATAAKESGLATGTPIIQSGHRSSCIAVAMDALQSGDVVVEMNNYGTLAINSDNFHKLNEHRTYATCNGMNDHWLYCADGCASVSNTNWVVNEIASGERAQARRSKQDPLEKLSEVAATIAPGSAGLVFTTPTNEHNGGFSGLNLTHHKHEHMIRAVFESSAMNIRACLNEFRTLDPDNETSSEINSLTLTGEAAKHSLWAHIISDTCGMPVQTVPYEYPAALGAALLAGSCIGIIKDTKKISKRLRADGEKIKPKKSATVIYDCIEQVLLDKALKATE